MSYQQPGPGYGPLPTAQWGAPQPPPPKKSKLVPILIGIGSFIVVLVIIGAATGGMKTGGGEPSTTQAAAPADPTPAPSKAPAKAPAKPEPALAKTVLTESGHGIKTTAKFTVHGDWDLHYTYDCTSFGFQGNFIVTTGGTGFPDPLANEIGKKGTDITHQHDGGTLYLDVNSECSWTVKVVDIP
ncbi:hypothetical protein V2S66_23210 [Streptomyces sp. V4-01]|uniref:Uncharacterized protein n=1 Tax=Actinacidiphila polyblastidii TaxID=3110430 RepID=A0ABU7PGB8_9ACTN|nr:hypothetical protein [Streptomyces sp. V4-01]